MRSEQRKLLAVLAGAALATLLVSGTGYVLLAGGDPGGTARPELSAGPSSAGPAAAAPVSAVPSAGAPAPTKVTTGPPRPTKPAPVTATTNGDQDAGPAIIRWIRKFTPTGGGEGGLSNIYALFMQRNCADVLDSARVSTTDDGNQPIDEPYRSLYEGAAAACLAGLHGEADLWPLARQRFDALEPAAFNCWHGQVYTILRELVGAHRGHRPISANAGEPLDPGCPEITGLQPNHGPRSGGYTITVSGRNLPPELDLLWRDINVTVTARRTASGTATMTVPAIGPDESPDIIIMIDGAPVLDPSALASFRYDD